MASKIILIPIYKQTMSAWEEKTYRQCLKVLGDHKIGIFTYKELNVSLYDQIAKEYKICIDNYYFDKHFFSSVKGYNQLMLTKNFYERFLEYQYMLIYQLDAWVFRDELDYWCDQNYDYIGAPIFPYIGNGLYSNKNPFVGNGGLSLRRPSYCLKVLSYPKYIPFLKPYKYVKYFKKKQTWYMIIVNALGRRNTLNYFIKNFNEDMIFSHFSSMSFSNVNLPKINIATKFAFELYPSILFKNNQQQLPFGCHAFEKYEYNTFWQKYIT